MLMDGCVVQSQTDTVLESINDCSDMLLLVAAVAPSTVVASNTSSIVVSALYTLVVIVVNNGISFLPMMTASALSFVPPQSDVNFVALPVLLVVVEEGAMIL